mmetsp:Transcript_122989/g.244754  ORF Transcript_122989/g.244754 Transcript_122989/m.244754 type:complete len:208 (-) Transcript_122989:1007-1630(-)
MRVIGPAGIFAAGGLCAPSSHGSSGRFCRGGKGAADAFPGGVPAPGRAELPPPLGWCGGGGGLLRHAASGWPGTVALAPATLGLPAETFGGASLRPAVGPVASPADAAAAVGLASAAALGMAYFGMPAPKLLPLAVPSMVLRSTRWPSDVANSNRMSSSLSLMQLTSKPLNAKFARSDATSSCRRSSAFKLPCSLLPEAGVSCGWAP